MLMVTAQLLRFVGQLFADCYLLRTDVTTSRPLPLDLLFFTDVLMLLRKLAAFIHRQTHTSRAAEQPAAGGASFYFRRRLFFSLIPDRRILGMAE